MKLAVSAGLFCAATIFGVAVALAEPFAIEVLDDQTGRGVPLVELTTTGNITFITDSSGLVAFDEPGLMDQKVHFAVKSHGYEFPKDGFGFRGVVLETKPGGSAQIKIKRLNIAERLYRVTGQGIYRDTLLLGRQPPIKEPVLNGQVIGCDSVQNTLYRGKIYWFWGDTNRPGYPLGNYHTTGATSGLEPGGTPDPSRKVEYGLDPALGVDLKYFTDDKGFAKPVCKMPGDGPTWISGVAALYPKKGLPQMLCGYAKIKDSLTVYRRGIAVWDDARNEFKHVKDFAPDVPLFPDGHCSDAYFELDDDYKLYFCNPLPLVRVAPNAESYQNLNEYEAFTCLKPGTTLAKPEIDRDSNGRIRYGWKRGTPPVASADQGKLISGRLIKPHEKLIQLRDFATGKEFIAHGGSVRYIPWPWRNRYVLIAVQSYGLSSFLGEVWYANADTPMGPWVYATKVVTHDKYSFYNPRAHGVFSFNSDFQGLIYFEGTYTHTFSGNNQATPRYDYNQIMYRLKLGEEERLWLPQAVYDTAGKGHAGDFRFAPWRLAPEGHKLTEDLQLFGAKPGKVVTLDSIRFFALELPRTGCIGISAADGQLQRVGKDIMPHEGGPDGKTIFYALPADTAEPGITVPLYEYLSSGTSPPIYDVRGELEIAGYQRCPEPVCRVWPSPYQPPAKSP